MTVANFKWKVDAIPTGQYRSFEVRGWPCAIYKNNRQDQCGDIHCKDDYTPASAKSGQHRPLTVRVCDYSVMPFKWRTLEGLHATLESAKNALLTFVRENPGVMPEEFRRKAVAV